MLSPNNIKALIKLMADKPEPGLKKQLAEIIKDQPRAFKAIIAGDFGGALPPAVGEVLETLRLDGFKERFAAYFKAKNAGLLDGLILLSEFIDKNSKEKNIKASFDALAAELPLAADVAFDIFHKAELFRNFIFGELGFKAESLDDERFISLADAVKRRRGTSLMLASIYVLLAERFVVDASVCIAQAAGRALVCFRDRLSLEPVFIDVSARGRFVSEEDCYSYALTQGAEFNPKSVKFLGHKEVIKRFMLNLIFYYGRAKVKPHAADLLRVAVPL
jgi:hypothetical protein